MSSVAGHHLFVDPLSLIAILEDPDSEGNEIVVECSDIGCHERVMITIDG